MSPIFAVTGGRMNNLPLTEDNFLLYAAKNYDNPQCYDSDEFFSDVQRITYLKRIFSKYKRTKEIKVTLVLNHIIIITNLFGPQATVRMLFLKCPDYLDCIKPFLVALNILPEVIHNIGEINTIYTDSIPLDSYIVEQLRKELQREG